MARFERRKVQQPTAQPVGNIYTRNSVQRVARPSVGQEQVLNVIKKHDDLLK